MRSNHSHATHAARRISSEVVGQSNWRERVVAEIIFDAIIEAIQDRKERLNEPTVNPAVSAPELVLIQEAEVARKRVEELEVENARLRRINREIGQDKNDLLKQNTLMAGWGRVR